MIKVKATDNFNFVYSHKKYFKSIKYIFFHKNTMFNNKRIKKNKNKKCPTLLKK